ncbi:MAG: fibronectin type III domain-containing protein, partial [Bacteroidales bacterium]|nr:fibronectin type III domain-containing protein [Bacteroidales bacterium]MBQ6101979.1 fibronectin type III domain-containing protein [Bacteroidales bacterium]
PTNLTVSNLAETVATIGWTENGNATQWQLCLNNDQNNLIAVNTNPFTLEGLTQETHYTVKVRDCHEGYNSAWSDAVDFTTLAYCAAPTDLAVDDIMRHSATLSWNANSDSYKVFYRTTGEWILAAENLSETTFTLTGLDAETHYEACVKGVCNGIESNASNSIDFYTLLDNVPTLTVDDITCTSAGLFWTETPGADSYTVNFNNSIEIPVNSGYTADTANPEGSNNERYTNLLDNNRSSKWYVHYAVNGVFGGAFIEFHCQHDFVPTGYVLTTANDTGNRPGRNPKDWVIKAKLHPDDPWTTIDSVTNDNVLKGESLTDFEFSLNNSAPYRYFRFEVLDVKNTADARFQLGEMRFLGDSKNSVYLTDLEPATAYSAKVRAKIGEINGEWSDEVNFSTLYLKPTNLTVTNLDYTSVTLDWTENGGANHWQLCLNDDENNLIDAGSNPFTITGLTQHSDYTAKVRVKQGEGYSSWSDIVRFATLFDVISPTLNVNNVTSTSADLNWTEISGVDGYTVCLNDSIVRFPSQIITGYTDTDGTPGNPSEDYPNLVDNDRSTKWCTGIGDGVYIEFQRESGFIPTGYILTTGNDNASKKDRNPKDWVIKAKLKEWEDWTTIATVSNDNILQDENTTDYEFAIDNHAFYRYFRFEVSATQGSDVFQLGELRFLGEVPTNSLHLTNLHPETDYAVKVRCDQEGIHSEWSNTVNFRTLYLPPTELTVSDIDHCSATLGWTSNSNIAQWQICLNGDEDHLILTNANPYILTGLNQHTHYTVKVRNCQVGADDAWSDEIEFTTHFDVTSPTLNVNNVTSTSADLNWTEISGVDGYTVCLNDSIVRFPSQIITDYDATRGTQGNSGEDYPNLVDNDRSTKWCTGIGDGVFIEFQRESGFIPTGYILTTGNDNASKKDRNPKNWVIKAKLNEGDEWTTIATVTNDTVLQDVNYTDFEFPLNNRAAYRYFRFEVSATQGSNVFQLGELRFLGEIPTNSLHLTNLLPETDYAVKVRGDFGETHSEWSNTVNFRTLYLPPTNLTVSSIDHCSATLGWTSNGNITQWQICLNGDETYLIDASTNPFVLSGLTAMTQYTVKVRNCQEGADDAWSDEIGFTTLFNIIAPTVTVNNITLTTAVLNWTAISGADGYTVSVNDSIIPDPIITGYTATSGASGYNSNEDYANLVDNDRSTKWCRSKDNVYIEFHSESSFVPTGYILTTGNDTHKNPQRNPKDWVIKAKLKVGDPWTTIGTVTNDQVLQDVNTTDYEFAIDNHLPYRYFRFEVSAVQSGDSFQLGELRFRGKTPTNSRILTELLPESNYAVKVRANYEESFSDWSNEVSFNTFFNGITFFADGNWNDVGNWNVSRVPCTDENVNVVAQAVVPAGYTAQVQNTNVIGGGSITIEDGGQFIAENKVKVAMRKNISAWTTDPVGGWYFIAPPVNTEDSDYSVTGLITEGEGKDYDLYQLNATVWENYKAEGGHYQFALDRGRGYLYASENGTEIEFNGNTVPYAETSIPLSDGFNLVGNPYTFNTYVNRPYYKLNSDRTDIELVNDNLVIAPCEGVLIEAEGADQVTFTKTDQLAQATNNGNLNIAVAHQDSSRGVAATSDKAIVSFNEGGQLGKFYFMQQDANIYIPQDGKDFAIAFSKKQGEMPLCFKAMKNGKYTITVAPENVKVGYLHLIDNLTGTDVDLLATSSYTFEGRTDDYVSRFKLVFIAYDNADNDDFAFISNGDIIINGKGLIQVVDVLGRTVLSKNLLNSTSHLSTLTLKSGVYVLRLVKGREVKTQKIILP